MERGMMHAVRSRPTLMLQFCMVVLLVSQGGRTSVQARSTVHRRNADSKSRPIIPSNISETCKDYGRRVGCNFQPLCFCDELCTTYNDCCFPENFESSGESLPDFTESPPPVDLSGFAQHRVCAELPRALIHSRHGQLDALIQGNYPLPYGIWMVGKCPPSWEDTVIRDLCEAPSGDAEDLLLLLPVSISRTTRDTDSTFRNIYCAVCHGVPLENITSFDIMSNVTTVNASISSEEFFGNLTSSKAFNKKNIEFDFHSSGLRRCLGSVVSDCPGDYDVEHVIKGCRSNMTAVVHPSTRVVYRNWYCALCNNALDSELRICGIVRQNPHLIFSTSLTAFIDFRGSGVFLEDADKTMKREIGIECGNNEIFDPFVMQCRNLLCPGELGHSNGRCINSRPPPDSLFVQSQNCRDPAQAELEVDVCFKDKSLSNPCDLWEECFGLQTSTPLVFTNGSCQVLKQSDHGLRCGTSARIRLSANATPEAEGSLVGALVGLVKNCQSRLSVARVVVKRGCHAKTRCHEYQGVNESSVYSASWNNSQALYLQEPNAVYLLSETFYQIEYHLNGSLRTVIICGDPIGVNCSVIEALNSSGRLNGSTAFTLSEVNRIILDSSGEALVCSNLASRPLLDYPVGASSFAVHIVTIVGFLISMLALIASFTTYLVFPSLRNLPGHCVMSLIAAVFMSQLLFLITGDSVAKAVGDMGCVFLAGFLHYACLSMFSWTSVLVYYLARTLGPGAKPSAATQRRNSFLIFSLLGWGTPLVFVILCSVLYAVLGLGSAYGISKDASGLSSCIIADRKATIAMVIAPIALSLLVNISLYVKILMGFTSRRATSTSLYSKEARWHRIKRDAFISIKIGFLLALTWVFGFLGSALQSEALLFVFCIMTSLQGLYIFLAFTFTQQVRALWRDKLGLKGATGEPVAKQKQQRKYFRKPNWVVTLSADKKGLCRKQSPSEHQTVDSAGSDKAKDVDNV